jgi:DNA-binding ferritin-like protein
MSLTPAEKKRIKDLEERVIQIGHLVEQTASKNMLNRMLTLANEETKKVSSKLDQLEAQMGTLLDLARKLQ